MNDLKSNFTLSSLMFALALGGLIDVVSTRAFHAFRAPSSTDGVSLSITNLAVDPMSRLHDTSKIFIRATINKTVVKEFGRGEDWTVKPGEKLPLNINVPVQAGWVQNDELEFKMELVREGFFEQTLVRCAQVAKQLSNYNRAFQCRIPGESTVLFSYRVGRPPEESLEVTKTAALQK